MRFKGLDLNLLVVFDALMAERNVSRAGAVLNLSQSATSGALARLRDYFGDELLVQQGRTMVPTALGAALAPQVRNALLQIDGTVIARPDFDPATATREVRIVASDYVMVVWLAPIIAAIARDAPGLRFRIEQPTSEPAAKLEAGAADLLLMPEKYLSNTHPSMRCFEDEYVVLASADNTEIGAALSVEAFYATPQVDAVFPTVIPGYSDFFTRQSGRERRIEVMAGSFTMLPHFVVGTRRIALVHRRLAEFYMHILPLRMIAAPIEIPRIVESLQWHRFAEEDACLGWVRDRVLAGGGIVETDS